MPVQDSNALPADMPVDEEGQIPEQTTEAVSAEEESQAEQTFTRAEVEAMLANFEKKMDSRIQSQVAKSENRTKQRIQSRLQSLEENRVALQLSDEDYAKAQDAIIAEEQKNAYKPQRPSGNESQQVPSNAEAQQVQFIRTVESIYQREGVTLDENSPEWKKYVEPIWNDPNGDPLEALAAVKVAAREQKERLESLKGKARARTMGGGERNASSSVYDPNKPASHYLEEAARQSKT